MENSNHNDTITDSTEAAKILKVSKHSVQPWAKSGVSQTWTISENDKQIYKDPEDGTICRRNITNPLILIVEDDVSVQAYYQVIFEFLLVKSDLEFAINGLEGLRKSQELNPSLLITDVNMPGMNGLEMLSLIQQNDNNKILHTVFVTALSKEQLNEHYNISDDINFYEKPLSIDVIKSILKNAKIIN